MNERGGVKHPTEISAADLANLLHREPLLHHLLDNGVVESNLLFSPRLVRPTAAAPTPPVGGASVSLLAEQRVFASLALTLLVEVCASFCAQPEESIPRQ
jgi:hypothetical protein